MSDHPESVQTESISEELQRRVAEDPDRFLADEGDKLAALLKLGETPEFGVLVGAMAARLRLHSEGHAE